MAHIFFRSHIRYFPFPVRRQCKEKEGLNIEIYTNQIGMNYEYYKPPSRQENGKRGLEIIFITNF
ncbi:hypothetical protein [Brunnivagina elsteri]|uniref:hypothetical protein n=1 Tax=Brunnivagina elsteri TaxID=1247191 RepID=UPI001B80708C|nr:hypothetical protein [Calothrix elsteri]